MFVGELERVIHNSALTDLNRVSALLWRGYASGAINESDAGRLASALELRRGVRRAELPRGMAAVALAFVPRRPQRSPDRQRSLLRRRQLAAGGALPPALACMFTVGEAAVLAIVAAEVRQQGCCDRSIDELAARAGASRSTVQRAVRAAAIAGLLTVETRPRRGQRSLTNVLRVVSREWLAWVKRAGRQGGRHAVAVQGVKRATPRSAERIQAVQRTGDSCAAAHLQTCPGGS